MRLLDYWRKERAAQVAFNSLCHLECLRIEPRTDQTVYAGRRLEDEREYVLPNHDK